MLKKYLQILCISYKNHTVYVYDVIWNMFIFWLRIVIISLLLKTIYVAGDMNLIGWFTVVQLSIAMMFSQVIAVSKPDITKLIDFDIKSWKISSYMLNPISYVRFKFFENFAGFLFNVVVFVVLGSLIILLMFGEITTSMYWTFGWVIMILFSMLISFFGYMLMGLFAFFVEDSQPFRWIYSKMDMLLWWNILPLPFLPWIWQTVAFSLPFAYWWYTAGLVFSSFSVNTFLFFFFVQLIWIFLLMLFCLWIYRMGKKNMNINWW